MMAARSLVKGKPSEWLIKMDIGGGIFRFSSKALTVTENGVSQRWIDALSLSDPPRSATSIEITINPMGVDWAKLASLGVSFASGTATLYRWWEGLTLEQCDVRATGPITEPEWGAPNEPLTFTLVVSDVDDSTVLPTPEQRIDSSTWPVAASTVVDEPAYGAVGPIIIGCPGTSGFLNGAWSYARPGGMMNAVAPAYLVERGEFARPASAAGTSPSGVLSAKLLIAYHEVTATEVCVADTSDGVAEVFSVQHTTDLKGTKVAYCDFSTATTVFPVPGHEYYTSWLETKGGGILRKDRSGTLRGAGEVIDYLLSTALAASAPGGVYNGKYDSGRQQTLRPYLDGVKIDAVINSPVQVNEWISTNLSSILPIYWTRGPDGWFWNVIRYDAQPHEVVARLDASTLGLRRVSRMKEPTPEYSRFVLDYGSVGNDRYHGRKILSSNPATTTSNDRPSWRCEIAEGRLAARSGLPPGTPGAGVKTLSIKSDVISDDTSADRIIDMLAAKHCIPPMQVQYQGPPDLEVLQPGDIVLLNDSESYLYDRVAIVRDITPGNFTTLDLDVLFDTGRRF